jgi:putative ABC transport system permease protein
VNKPIDDSFALRILGWFCPRHLREEIEGDLLQKFDSDKRQYGEKKAKRKLLWKVIRYCRPGIILRNKFNAKLNSVALFQNYLKITIRNLNRRRAYALINVLGLAVGMAVCLVIGKYIEFETSYDSFHANAKNIYRVVSSFYTDGTINEYNGYDVGPALLRHFPEVKSFVRIHGNEGIVRFTNQAGKEKRFQEKKMLIVDSTFFKVFSFKLNRGNNSSALSSPNSIVLTESLARRYFKNVDPIGKIIHVAEGWIPGLYEVSAVVEDVPPNSHFDFDFLMPMHNLLQSEFYRNNNSRWDNFHTYVEIHEKADISGLERKILSFIKKYKGDDRAISSKSVLQFQNLLDIHYSPNLQRQGSHRTSLYFFGVIAVLVLVIAWVNYINLSTARSMQRAREVGVKKALGVSRTQLITQFIFESVLVNLISVLLAIGLAILLLPLLNDITGRTFSFDFTETKLLSLLISLFVVGSFASGSYPAFVLSSFKATEVIKGKVIHGGRGLSLRNGLVGFQFASSLLLLIGTLVIYRQINFMKSQEKGFDLRQTVVVNGPELAERKNLGERMISFKNELLRFPFVGKVSTSFSVPGNEASMSNNMRKFGKPIEESRVGNVYWVDPEFITLYNIPMMAGKIWNPQVKSEMKSVIINEECVKVFQLGTNASALNERIILPENDTVRILGVMKNHHWNSLKKPYEPMIFRAEVASAKYISIQLKGNTHDALVQIERKYKADFPDDAFSFYFLDDFYNSQYQAEQQFGKLFSMFSILAVLIGCLGLWGLATFTTVYRLKEISIRKVLGASVNSIIYLLTSQFLKPLLIASLVVLPVVWLGVTAWLETFPYRINFSSDLFLLPLLVLVIVACTTVCLQTIRAARANPVNSLKSE